MAYDDLVAQLTLDLQVQDFLHYSDLLAALRRDLQLNPGTDLLQQPLLSASNDSWVVDQGIAVVNYPTSMNATDLVVNHRLGKIPALATLTQVQPLSAGQLVSYAAVSGTSTTFTIEGRSSVAVTGNVSVCWLVIG